MGSLVMLLFCLNIDTVNVLPYEHCYICEHSETHLCSQECCDLSSRAGEAQPLPVTPSADIKYTSDTREFASWKH